MKMGSLNVIPNTVQHSPCQSESRWNRGEESKAYHRCQGHKSKIPRRFTPRNDKVVLLMSFHHQRATGLGGFNGLESEGTSGYFTTEDTSRGRLRVEGHYKLLSRE